MRVLVDLGTRRAVYGDMGFGVVYRLMMVLNANRIDEVTSSCRWFTLPRLRAPSRAPGEVPCGEVGAPQSPIF